MSRHKGQVAHPSKLAGETYSMLRREGLTLAEIGARFNVSRQAVSRALITWTKAVNNPRFL